MLNNVTRVAVREWTTKSEVQCVAPLRRDVVAFAAEHGVEEIVLPDLALAVSEVLGNIAAHDRANGSATPVRLTMDIADDHVVVRVEGSGLAPPEVQHDGPRLGLVVVAFLARSVSVDPRNDGGTTVSMVFDRRAA